MIEIYQNNNHVSLKLIANEKDKQKGLKFGKILLSLRSICQLVLSISIENLFFKTTVNGRQFNVAVFLKEMIQKNEKTAAMSDLRERHSFLNYNNILAFNLPSYLTAAYYKYYYNKTSIEIDSDATNGTTSDIIHNSNPISNGKSLLSSPKNPFFYQMINQNYI